MFLKDYNKMQELGASKVKLQVIKESLTVSNQGSAQKSGYRERIPSDQNISLISRPAKQTSHLSMGLRTS